MLTDEQIQFIQKRTALYAYKLKKLGFFKNEDLADLQHDLWCDVLKALERFDEQRGVFEHFVENVIRKHVYSSIRSQFALKKAVQSPRLSWDRVPEAELPHHDFLENQLLDRISLQKYLKKMPVHLRSLIEQLQYHSIRSLSKETQISRFYIQNFIQQARPYLQNLGSDFLVFRNRRVLCVFL